MSVPPGPPPWPPQPPWQPPPPWLPCQPKPINVGLVFLGLILGTVLWTATLLFMLAVNNSAAEFYHPPVNVLYIGESLLRQVWPSPRSPTRNPSTRRGPLVGDRHRHRRMVRVVRHHRNRIMNPCHRD